jgi:DNA-binding transcriptional ArsR family regulator
MQDTLDLRFAALADPTRRAMLRALAKGEADVSSLARPFLRRMSRPAVTKHLKVLERAGLISKRRRAQHRPCRLNPEALRDVGLFTEEIRAHFEESLDRLGAYLASLSSTASHDHAKKTPKP